MGSAMHGIEQFFSHFGRELFQTVFDLLRKNDVESLSIIIGTFVIVLAYYIAKAVFAKSTEHTKDGACALLVGGTFASLFYCAFPHVLPFLYYLCLSKFDTGEAYYQVASACKCGAAEQVKWYGIAVKQGNEKARAPLAIAYNNLGDHYFYGNGVKQDYDEATKWHVKVTNQ